MALDPEEIFGGMEEGNDDDPEDINSVADTKKCRHKSPVKTHWLVPLVKLAIVTHFVLSCSLSFTSLSTSLPKRVLEV
jgi:hypothetical protein